MSTIIIITRPPNAPEGEGEEFGPFDLSLPKQVENAHKTIDDLAAE